MGAATELTVKEIVTIGGWLTANASAMKVSTREERTAAIAKAVNVECTVAQLARVERELGFTGWEKPSPPSKKLLGSILPNENGLLAELLGQLLTIFSAREGAQRDMDRLARQLLEHPDNGNLASDLSAIEDEIASYERDVKRIAAAWRGLRT